MTMFRAIPTLVALLVRRSVSTQCSSSPADMFAQNFAEGERAFMLTEVLNPKGSMAAGKSAEDMWTTKVMCLVKGEKNTLAEPMTELQMKRSMFWLFAQLACKFSQDHFGSPVDATCKYPPMPSGLTHIPERGSQQESWYGPLMQMPRINGEDLNDPSLDSSATHAHSVVDGATSTSCTASTGWTPPAGDDRFVTRRSNYTWYDGGAQVTIRHGSYLTMRAFMFKTDADRNAAIAASSDSQNAGLKYAHSFGGNHGCDVEVVLEVKPFKGGGIHVMASLPLESMTEEREIAVRSSIKVFQTEEETVVLVGAKEFREAQHRDVTATNVGDLELLRFSRSFICKATGDRVQAELAFVRADDSTIKTFSTNSSSPTTFQTDPPTQVQMHKAAAFTLTLTQEQAPESCGTLYWDPLLQTPSKVTPYAYAGTTSTGAETGGAAPTTSSTSSGGTSTKDADLAQATCKMPIAIVLLLSLVKLQGSFSVGVLAP